MITPLRPPVAAIFADGLDHPEGVAVAPDGDLWAGGEEGQIYVVGPTGAVREHARIEGFAGGLAFDRSGDCFVCSAPGRVVRVAPDGRWETFADAIGGLPLRAPNYPVFGPDGSLYVSDSGGWGVADGVIARFSPDGSGETFHGGPFHYPNGLAVDAAGEYLYVVESGRHRVVRLRLADGRAAAAEPVGPAAPLEWVPDGLAFDALGRLYVTMYASDRIYRLGSSLELVAEDPLGMTLNRPTNCAFGGPALDRLFVANLGGRHLAVIELETPGQALFGGPSAGNEAGPG
ncbi:MAG: SMP-30/gluconolactonase/LRE family protein [Chloroflexi bacterium]|nr:SMP-30/gluconolactonase/LRE family protein [Chloroflexota bacterium]